MASLSLGPFELDTPMARGGTGLVWKGSHPGQGVPVAVKVLKPGADPDEFRNEVQAVAALHHPGVVLVFDHGIVTSETARRSELLAEGSPWLAMEYASRGSLKSLQQQLRWADVRGVLLSVLDALAHAHARGVVHRDIKPGNILIGGPEDLRPGVKLADFGLARGVEDFGQEHSVAGTPVYMSPEQFRGAWRSFGPWTDLYSLGIVAWELVCGSPPFLDNNVRNLGALHLRGVLPAFEPRMPVPGGMEAWLRRMLASRIADRYQRAADAAWGLTGLPEPTDDDAPNFDTTTALVSNPTMTLDDTLVLRTGGDTTESAGGLDLDTETTSEAVGALIVQVPPLPPSWKRPDPPAAPMQLLGAGLNLFGLRTVPLVARTRERDRMWDTLIDAAVNRNTLLCVLQGAAGNGKSRLVEWISQRAHEVGGATVLRAIHGPTGGPMDGLAPMLARHFRAVGLDRTGVDAELALHPGVPLNEETALAELILPAPEGTTGGVRLNSAEERWVVVERVIRSLAKDRPVVVWLDDIQWGADALGFARWILARPPIGPLLILCTAQEEALGDLPGARAALDEVVALDSAHRIALGPLDPGDREALVRALLGLEGPLAAQLAERTGGNPLFTVQLVGDWVARGVLVPGRDGFRLRPGERAVLPDDLHQVWSTRIERLLAGRPAIDRDALELAAALGQEVASDEWHLVCTHGGIAASAALVEELVSARLAVPSDTGWAFSHGMLRESLQRLAQEQGRWADHNRTCALALSSRRQRGLETRLGHHWYAAGEYARAAELLRRGAASQRSEGDPRQSRHALALAAEALKRARISDRDPRWGELWLENASSRMSLGDLDEALREARRVLTHAKRHKWRALLGPAWDTIGATWKRRGDLQQALEAYQTALECFTDGDDAKKRAHALVSLAHTRILGGQIPEARDALVQARAGMLAVKDRGGLGLVIRFEGDLARLEGDWQGAWDCFQQAAKLARDAGQRGALAMARHGMAEMERLLGRLDDAERGYREVIGLDNSLGSDASIPRLNLGLCLIARDRFTEARSQLEDVLAEWSRDRRRGYLSVGHISLVPAVAGCGDWRALDHHLDEFQHLSAATGMTDIDNAHCTARAAELCEGAGQHERARRCWEICAATWDALGNAAEADAAMTRALSQDRWS